MQGPNAEQVNRIASEPVRRVTAEIEETLGHRIGQPAVAREVSRQAVVEQIHQPRLGPQSGKRGLDRHNRMFQGVDEGDAHARTIPRARRACQPAASRFARERGPTGNAGTWCRRVLKR